MMPNSSSSKKMRVLVAIASDIATDMRVTKVVRFLCSIGFVPQVICCKRSEIEWRDDFQAIRMRMLVKRSFLFYLMFNLRLFLRGIFHQADIILANDLDTLPACRLLGWLKGIPVIYDSHEYFTESVGLFDRPFVKRIWQGIEKLFLPGVSAAYTVSQPIADAYQKLYGIPFRVIRNYPDLQQFPQRKNYSPYNNSKYILYQGVFNPSRSIPQLIEAMQWVDKEYHLVLAGHGELEDELRQLVKNLKLQQRVVFTGSLPYHDLIQYTYHASLGIALEESQTLSFKYSLPNKVFDYVAASLPFVTLGTPLVREMVEKMGIGILVENNYPDYLAQQINFILQNESLLESIRIRQKEIRHLFSWENECQNLSDLFHAVK
ncbi:MAG: glycosyltransferase family 4 protein [Flavobacteriales bacterium]